LSIKQVRLLIALVFALTVFVPASALAQGRSVSVIGTVTQQVPNDSASLGFSVSEKGGSRVAALKSVSRRLAAVIAVVQAAPGVGAGDVTTGQVSVRRLRPQNRTNYLASEGISVTTHQPLQAGELISAALRAGATGTRGPTFFVGSSELAYNQALAAAFEQAKTKAAALATEAGASLGPVISIEEGGEVSTPPVSPGKASPGCSGASPPTKASRSACISPEPPVNPGTSAVTATVHVVFELL
jgi:uncharacterized protein